MKQSVTFIMALLAILMLLSACESGGKFRVKNNCSYPAYVKVGSGAQITLPAQSDVVFDIDTDTQSMFTGTVSTDIKVLIIGETFSLYDSDLNQFTDSTWVNIQAGETLDAYLNPNRASIKVVNSSSQNIKEATVWKHSGSNHIRMGSMLNIAPGSSKFLRVDYITPTTNFYYQVSIIMDDDSTYMYGDETTVLNKDQQFLVTHTDPI